MKNMLEQGARKVLQALLQHGYEAYLVGGCVRDKQLCRAVKDYDIATSARPEQVLELFERTIPTGLQHGTISVLVGGNLYEVTTFRKEEAYEQFRRPTEVQFIDSLHEDLQRRDFTMNAMALDLHDQLIDPFGGLADMQQGILRCVGNPAERFTEDALRMLRCIRFSSEYGLEIEAETWTALCQHASLLKHIAMERVRMELDRMITGSDPVKALELLVLSGILYETKKPLKLAQLEREPSFAVIGLLSASSERWTYLYLSLGLNAIEVEADMRVLTFSKLQMRVVCDAISATFMLAGDLLMIRSIKKQESAVELELEQIWKLAALTYGKEALRVLRTIWLVDPQAAQYLGITSEVSSLVITSGEDWLNELIVDRLEQLAVGGKELLVHIHRPPGPWLAEVLRHLLHETALGRLVNEPNALITEAKRFVERHNPEESGTFHEHK
jgi:tRNA nucleotidyltransferase (CCA-adding enzyme)